jgi:hypothetical protein
MYHDNGENAEIDEPEHAEIEEGSVWHVIDSFFAEKGLVRQQLDSFNEFVTSTIQEIIDEDPVVSVKPQNQYIPGQEDVPMEKEVRVKFGQLYLQKPTFTESDSQKTDLLFPREARLRNLTCVVLARSRWSSQGGAHPMGSCRYSASMFIDIQKSTITTTSSPDGDNGELTYTTTEDQDEPVGRTPFGKARCTQRRCLLALSCRLYLTPDACHRSPSC